MRIKYDWIFIVLIALCLAFSGCTGAQVAAPTSTTTLVPTATLVNTMISPRDGMVMVYVQAGEFKMGSTDADKLASDDEKPQHTVYLDAFWIDRTEVTNKMYALCVAAGACQPPSYPVSYTRQSYYDNSEFNDYPVIYVSWDDAQAYCKWAGRDLPTEAQWEKAARGTDGRIYPWGNNAPSSNLLNYKGEVGDTTVVGKYPNGVSPYGALDMAGNVWEWVADWYSDTYYQSSPSSNPLGPDLPGLVLARVLRGGSWSSDDNCLDNCVRSAERRLDVPSDTYYYFGFRCSRSLP